MSATAFGEAYEAALRAYLAERDERRLREAYELGRQAVGRQLALLDLARAHHEALAAVLEQHESARDITAAAGEFFVESLSAYEMAQRVYREARDQAALERRQAAMLRQLSTFLADASLALGASDSLAEMLQLVAEEARELVGAGRCIVALWGGPGPPEHASSESEPPPAADSPTIAAALTALDGRPLGQIELAGKQHGSFTPLDEAVLTQLAQLAAAAVERRGLYSGV